MGTANLQHVREHVKEAYSHPRNKVVPAHERHTLTNGVITAHGCESFEAAQRLFGVHVYRRP